ncbi:MAG: pyridoxamine 5'-phosphate oxidase family protein [Fimbriiglobus sp.]|jgi:hypothetical protein|nr:pyridoxamine 5'-phosphate oxidase family protein [Fimbriiglobus sp.]
MRDILPVTDQPILALADLADPVGTWGRLCRWLTAGATTPTHPFRWPVLSTVADDGGPDARTVVLRRFDHAARQLVFHTDVRSAKVTDLRRDARCTFLFYDADDRLQMRVRAVAAIHHADDFARAEFAALPPHNRATYASVVVPGEVESTDAPFVYPPKPPVDEAVSFGHFAAVACVIERIDALELHPSGHRRAVLEWNGAEVRIKRVGP